MCAVFRCEPQPPPLVSCIIPTRNRRPYVGQAIGYFLRQDYERKELLILDDGEDDVADLIPRDDRVRHVRLDRLPLGSKRNSGCKLASGELIAHWDDDDWMAPHRLRLQVEQLLAAGADVCGTRELLHLRLDAGEAWLYRCPDDEKHWLAGGTLLYRRTAWEAHPFPPLTVGEDTAFVRRLPGDRLHAVPDNSWYVAIIHGGNTGARNLSDPSWQQRPLAEVSQRLGADRTFYVSLRTGGARPAAPARPAATLPVLTGGGLPRVSCLMPTADRRRFVARSIAQFLRQDYPHRELIVVDDGNDPVGDLVPADPRIRYLRLEARESIGAKRSRAAAAARGAVLICWDDDDWYGPGRITRQVLPLIQGTADASGFSDCLILVLPAAEFWSCTPRLQQRLFDQGVVSGTIAFRRELWEQGARFPDRSVGEDAVFVRELSARGARLARLHGDDAFLYVRHQTNTWRFRPGDFLDPSGWRRAEAPAFLTAGDRTFFGLAPAAADAPGNLGSLPLVSCIMPTGGRRLFLRQAIKYFLRQTYPHKELIIVDDDSVSADDLVPVGAPITYLRVPPGLTAAAKMNLAVTQARGSIVQKIDDDDYYHPDFLQTNVTALREDDPERALVGFDCFLVLIAATGELKFSGHGWCAGATHCFTRRLWESKPFREVPTGEDRWFLHDHQPRQLKIRNPELFMVVRHSDHQWSRMGNQDVTAYFRQQPAYTKPLEACVPAEDLAFYAGLRASAGPLRGD